MMFYGASTSKVIGAHNELFTIIMMVNVIRGYRRAHVTLYPKF